MEAPGLILRACTIVALATLAACGSVSAMAPPAAATGATYSGRTLFLNGDPVTAARLNPFPVSAQLAPVSSKATDYEYVTNSYHTYATIFDYPKGTAAIGYLKGAGGQSCTNVLYGYGKGIIWNAGRVNDSIIEYQVPSNKMLKKLSLDYKYTSSCAMDTAGDLAVGILLGNSGGRAGQVVFFKGATGEGTVYPTPLHKEYFDGYDPSGNLFADGLDADYHFMLVEIKKGSTKGVKIVTSNSPEFPGSVQWDGQYVSVFDQVEGAAYQYSISGTTATLENTVQLTGTGDCAQTWIVTGLIYCGDAGNNNGSVYQYPAGGAPLATFTGKFVTPLGVVAAQK